MNYQSLGLIDQNYNNVVRIPRYCVNNSIRYEIIEIGSSAFRICQNIPKFIISQTIRIIMPYAFDICTICTDIIFAPGSRLETLTSNALCRMYNIRKIIIPNSVKILETHCINYMKGLQELYICGNPSTIGDDILFDKAVNDVTAPQDLKIFVPYDFDKTLTYRSVIKSEYNRVCDLVIDKTCFNREYSRFNFFNMITVIIYI